MSTISIDPKDLAKAQVLFENAYDHGYLRVKSARIHQNDPNIMVHTLQVNFFSVWVNLICMNEFTGTIPEQPIAS